MGVLLHIGNSLIITALLFFLTMMSFFMRAHFLPRRGLVRLRRIVPSRVRARLSGTVKLNLTILQLQRS
ncbi:hypothetical protein GCK32_019107 [Trichostrongylus colubriformis]|uniref:Uncharacterized protein n=1 Tax=Trichostrongylus colubriformis TaxID=6319 RepID=A0AAN8FP94_TRICO